MGLVLALLLTACVERPDYSRVYWEAVRWDFGLRWRVEWRWTGSEWVRVPVLRLRAGAK